ncbi:DUF3560 domain-containing protein [Thalassobellus suaedae]|uniref:DUF3560 domain-containing protein n=1 Tax=Thalassobellus suaedae TaxID=3074124 RepID=A0ABY9XVU2_9FLAO|nr:DUF3560 domain-containing protein [Flavobacteriaceae bacterium HL-DH14]
MTNLDNQTETTLNTYKKYCPNVFVAKCTEQHEKGDTIILTTKYGKEHENEVHNYLGKTNDGFYLYSITRVDGFNTQERAKNKAEKLNGYASNAEKRSTTYYEASKEGKDFLSLGEPIKIGHHSERRHRALIQRNWDRMGKSVAETEKAEDYKRRAEYWEAKTNDINLSMPESLSFYEFKLEEAKKNHKFLKDNPEKRAHSYSLTYANKAVKETEKNLNLAVKLWGSNEEIQQINQEKEDQAKHKLSKKSNFDELLNTYGGFSFLAQTVKLLKKSITNF